VVHFCNPSTREVEARGSEFEAGLAYIVRTCLKEIKKRKRKKKEIKE
jgi:hypothetical protein